MDQNPEQDRDWDDLKGVLADDIINKFKEVGPKVYAHQYEFMNYCLGQDINLQSPVIALRSQTGSGKTLCFQSLIYQEFKDKNQKISEQKQIKQKDNTMKEVRMLYPYTIVLGQTIYLKQHEEYFRKHLPERLKNQNLKFQTFFAFTKDNQFQQVKENRIEDADCQVYLCHPSKMLVGLKNRIINVSNLRYLIIDEADQLLEKNEQNQARIETMQLIQFILGQTNNQSYQIIFVSASLKPEEIQSFIKECVQNNIDANKKVDTRFLHKDEDDIQEVICNLRVIPSIQQQISPYTIVHMYKEAVEQPEQILVDLLKDVFDKFTEAQVMIFFNKKTIVNELINLFKKSQKLEYIVKNNWIGECTGDTNQVDRETVRKEFKDGKKKILLCTDVLQRGMDFRKVRVIIHYGLPITPAGEFKQESYYQRSGRTGRAKDEGVVVSLLLDEDIKQKRQEKLVETLVMNNSKIQKYDQKQFCTDLAKLLNFNKE
ncbi:unnamed protein product [Paramecium pentaurelia]|uniref:ATP-dependent RNA helicase n=1 Tax=Paramecium pentaurelia TaxID=43138 RepID=A0A8S1URZ6_9CILI|nr:unnamed protein product [Paramecium pentaurelia]